MKPPASRSLALLVTFGVPALLFAASEIVLIPGVAPEAFSAGPLGLFGSSKHHIGVFALGLGPVTTAAVLVELVAFLVPRWRGLRHGDPAGRKTLDARVRVLMVAFALFQAFSMVNALVGMQAGDAAWITVVDSPGLAFTLKTMATLLAGVCVQFIAAEFISRKGIMNGLVVLAGAEHARTVVGALGAELRGIAEGIDSPISLVGLALAIAATWLALRNAGTFSLSPQAQSRDPYRGGPILARLEPTIPIPSGSFQVYYVAVAVLALPAFVRTGLHSVSYWLPFGVVVALCTLLFSRLMHRPEELAKLARRVSDTDATEFAPDTARALRAAFVPSMLLFAALLLASNFSQFGALGSIVLLVAITMDITRALRGHMRHPDWVEVWKERRATAVPILRAALHRYGIATEVRGAAVAHLLQAFAPYAPSQIYIAPADAEHADAMLRYLCADGPPPPPSEVVPLVAPNVAVSISGRMKALAACAFVAALLVGSHRGAALVRGSVHSGHGTAAQVKIEFVRIDDGLEPFKDIAEEKLPPGVRVMRQVDSIGRGTAEHHHARIVLEPGGSKEDARASFLQWLRTLPLPSGARFALQDDVDYDDETGTSKLVGLSAHVLVGASAVGAEDVTDAAVAPESASGGYSVSLTFSPAAAKRFEDMTREWTGRRIAIVVNDEVRSAPIVRTAITGGHVSISMGAGDREKQLAEARELVQLLQR
jgi:hypothetical protein